jgi:hypothetical protein
MPVLDTFFIVDLLRGNEEALKKLAEMEAGHIPSAQQKSMPLSCTGVPVSP